MGCDRKAASAQSGAQVTTNAPAEPGLATFDPSQLVALTQAVRKYGAEQRQAPQTLEEVVAKGYLDQTPSPPPGKRFLINKQLEVVVVNR